jgi:hypothetical protein
VKNLTDLPPVEQALRQKLAAYARLLDVVNIHAWVEDAVQTGLEPRVLVGVEAERLRRIATLIVEGSRRERAQAVETAARCVERLKIIAGE